MSDSNFRLDKKCIVMSGALGILGSVFSEVLANAGAKLVLVDLDGDACQRRAEELADKFGDRFLGVGADVGDPASCQAAAETIERNGYLANVLINNAGHKSENFFAPIETFPLEDWDEVMRVNVTGVFLMVQAFMPGMMARGGGTIISTGSLYGVRGPDQRIYEGSYYEAMGGSINTPMVYSASKGAVSAITRYIATSFGDRGIRANTLIPGGVFSGQNDTFVGKFSNRAPMGRMAAKSEIASALVFLASDASQYMSGQDLVIDGGVTAW